MRYNGFARSIFTIVLIILSMLSVSNYSYLPSSQYFTRRYVDFKSNVNDTVYPGSYAYLNIGYQYLGYTDANYVLGCIIDTYNFTFVNTCSKLYAGNESLNTISHGEIAEFRYQVRVPRNITPGVYVLRLNITFIIENNVMYEVDEFTVTVNSYPPLNVSIVDSYLSPRGYPGSTGVSLYILVRNNGFTRIAYGEAILYLPSVFQTSEKRSSIPSIQPGDQQYIVFNGLNIPLNISTGVYNLTLKIQATLATRDNILYTDEETIVFNVTIEPPPRYNLEILDYGFTANKPYRGVQYTSLYLTLLSLDDRVIDTGIAYIKALDTIFSNGSSIALTVFNGPYSYGDVFTIVTPRFETRLDTSIYRFNITLQLLVYEDNTYYWVVDNYFLVIQLEEPDVKLYILNTYWGSGFVYPGSTGESLNIILYNMMDVAITDLYAEIHLPNGFNPEIIINGGYTVERGSTINIVFNNINIHPDIKPGNYTAILVLTGVLHCSDNSFLNFTIQYPVLISVNEPVIEPIDIVYVDWVNGRSYPYTYNAGVEVIVKPKLQVSVVSGKYTLILPPGVYDAETGWSNKTLLVEEPLNYGSYQTLVFNNLYIGDVTGYTSFALKTELYISLNGAEYWFNKTYVFTLTVDQPLLNITLLDTYWSQRVVSNTAKQLSFNILFRSDSLDQIEVLSARLEPLEGMIVRDGGIWIRRTPVEYGEYFTITFNNIDINTDRDYVLALLNVNASLSVNNARYNISKKWLLNISLNKVDEPLQLVSIRYIYQGEYVKPLPNTRGLIIEITLLNTLQIPVETIIGKIMFNQGIEARGDTSICSNIPAGSTCVLTYTVDVQSGSGQTTGFNLDLRIVAVDNGGYIYLDQSMNGYISIDNPDRYRPRFKIIDVYWGSNQPEYVYPGDRYAPLTVVILNNGMYPSGDTVLYIKPLNTTVNTLSNSFYCGGLNPGAICRAVFYLDLARSNPGLLLFNIVYDYNVRLYGSINNYVDVQTVEIMLPAYETMIDSKKLMVVDQGWLNDWVVYPNTEKAVYTVTIANLYPYPLTSIYVELILPEGFNFSYINSSASYIPGPVNSLNTFALTYTVDIGSVTPGVYAGVLKLQYIVGTANNGFRTYSEIPVFFEINDPSNSLMIYQYGWLSGEPGLKTYGAVYYVLFRNNEYPSINGALLEVHLPPGVSSSVNNASIVVVNPSIMVATGSVQDVYRQLLGLTQAPTIPSNPVISRGDIFGYNLKLNLMLDKPGNYTCQATLDFIDHWGTRRRVSFNIPLIIHGKPDRLTVDAPSEIYIVNGEAKYELSLINNYPVKITNIYTALIPQTYTLIPLDNVKYVETLEPYQSINLEYRLVYSGVSSPTSIYGFTSGSVNTAVFVLTIVYSDASGGVNIYNTTLAVNVKPFIDVKLSPEVKAEYSRGSITITGSVINYGLTEAYSVLLTAVYRNTSSSTFIGTIDPASQAAFRLEIKTSYQGGDVTLVLTYRDQYNSTYVQTYSLPVKVVEYNQLKPSTGESSTEWERYIIISVVLFLAIAGLMIYVFLRRHSKRLE